MRLIEWSWLGLPPGTKIKPQWLLKQSPLFLSWILAWWSKNAKALGDIRSWEGFCPVPSLTVSSELTHSVLGEIEKRMTLTLWLTKKQQLFYRPEWGAGGISAVGILFMLLSVFQHSSGVELALPWLLAIPSWPWMRMVLSRIVRTEQVSFTAWPVNATPAPKQKGLFSSLSPCTDTLTNKHKHMHIQSEAVFSWVCSCTPGTQEARQGPKFLARLSYVVKLCIKRFHLQGTLIN